MDNSGPLGQLARLILTVAIAGGATYLAAYAATHLLVWALARLFGA